MFARIWRYIEGPVLLFVPLCMGIMLYLGIAQSALLMLAHAGAFRRASGSVRTSALLAYGAATCVFLAALYVSWTRRIDRVVRKYDLRAGE